MPSPLDLLGYGGAALGAIAGLRGNRNASRRLQQGVTDASGTVRKSGEELRRLYDANYATQQQRLAPWLTAGNANADMLNAGLQEGGGLADPFKFTQQDQLGDAGYQFTLAEGNKAIEAARRSMGTRFSGGAVKQAIGYNQGMGAANFQQVYDRNENTFRQNQGDRYSRLKAAADQGFQATGAALGADQSYADRTGEATFQTNAQLADLQQQLASAEAAGDIGTAETITNTINGVLDFANKSGTAKALQGLATGAGGAGATALSGAAQLAGIAGLGGTAAAGASAAGAGAGLATASPYFASLPASAAALGGGGVAAGGTAATGLTGAAGLGGGAGLLGLGAATIPVIGGAIAGGILLAKHYVGAGRKQADKLTGEGGLQRAFETTLSDIDNAPGFTPAQRWEGKTSAYDDLEKRVLKFAAEGKTQRKAASQMFDEISKLFGKPNPLRAA